MPNDIYIVTGYTSCDRGTYEWNVAAFKNKQDAIDLVKELNEWCDDNHCSAPYLRNHFYDGKASFSPFQDPNFRCWGNGVLYEVQPLELK